MQSRRLVWKTSWKKYLDFLFLFFSFYRWGELSVKSKNLDLNPDLFFLPQEDDMAFGRPTKWVFCICQGYNVVAKLVHQVKLLHIRDFSTSHLTDIFQAQVSKTPACVPNAQRFATVAFVFVYLFICFLFTCLCAYMFFVCFCSCQILETKSSQNCKHPKHLGHCHIFCVRWIQTQNGMLLFSLKSITQYISNFKHF